MEVRNDYTDDNGYTHIDVWQDDSDDSEGATVAIVCQDTGKVYFIDNSYIFDKSVLEAIEEVKPKLTNGSRLKEFKTIVAAHKNQLILNMFEVCRLVNIVEEEDDFYWVFETSEGNIFTPCIRKTVHSSCLIEWIPLKDYLPLDKYESLKTIWNLNAINKCE